MKRYSAKLLIQFRVTVDGIDGRLRTCEERIVVFLAKSAKHALATAKRKGVGVQHRYTNSDGNPVHIEFVGVMELLCLDPQCEPGEVWYEIRNHLLPMERADKFIPPEVALEAIRNETPNPRKIRKRPPTV